MSFEAMAWAVRQTLPTRDKFVLLMMANYASSDRGDCYPSIGKLCKQTGLCRTSVIEAIKALEAAGALSIRRRSLDGVSLPNYYVLHLTWSSVGASDDEEGVVQQADHPYKFCMQGGSPPNEPPVSQVDGGSPPNGHKPINQPIKEKRERAREPVVAVTFNESAVEFDGITQQQLEAWEKAYPDVGIRGELARAAAWVLCSNQPRKRNYLRFLNGWLGRAKPLPSRRSSASGASAQSGRAAHREAFGDLFGGAGGVIDMGVVDDVSSAQ